MIPYAEHETKSAGRVVDAEFGDESDEVLHEEGKETSEITRDFQAARRILKCVEREFGKMTPEGIEYARMRIQKILDKP